MLEDSCFVEPLKAFVTEIKSTICLITNYLGLYPTCFQRLPRLPDGCGRGHCGARALLGVISFTALQVLRQSC